MTVADRIAYIRLAEKLSRDAEYAEKLGVQIQFKNPENEKKAEK